ncbi:MAG: peptide/nickel transport system permease protein [Rhodospirillaceae bacterium]|jgi:peptide/nickel transport system permease protein|nr:peptide/nickel transport system permease protein [Rhodospirillaceae bacterium]
MSAPPIEAAGALDAATPASARRERLRLLFGSGTFVVGLFIVVFWVGCALFGSHLVPLDPYADDLENSLIGPSAEHWFGTDQLGRDVFSRVIVGARDILTVAPLATILGTILGTALGLLTGYFRGFVDDAISRLVDAVLALPLVIIALLALVALGTSNVTVVVVIGVVFAPIIARTVRSAVLSERELDYVAAAKLRGENAFYIMFVEILPNVIPPILVETTVRLGYAIFAVATLSFIGFGIQPPSPDWGLAISDSYGLINGGYWWTVLFDALAIASLVVGVNLVADGIQGALET